jgi:outer membrane protein OmpA-like peptidoglycan-associated protein
MRKWFVAVAMFALLVLPLGAQQKNSGTSDAANATGAAAEKNNVTETSVNVVPASRSMSALAATPRATPFAAPAPQPDIFTDWANNAWNRNAWGQLTPRYEVAGMFDFINFSAGEPFQNFGNLGGTGSFTYNASKWLGLTAEAGTYTFKNRDISPLNGSSSQASGGLSTYLFGPRLNLRKYEHFVPFGEFLAGGAHADENVTGDSGQNAFAVAIGGGVDVVLWKNLAWRFAQLDYLLSNFSGSALGGKSRQNNFRAASGLVLRWGYPPVPPKPNHPPVASCSANPGMVYQGSNDAAAIHVNATDADNDPLTYSYTASSGAVDGTGPDARWNSSGVAIGTYTVNAKVDDGKGGTATCSADIKVEERPHHPPSISCAPDRSPILPGEHATIQSTASSPDNLKLTYNYSATGGQVSGTGPTATFDSTGLAQGSYKVNCGVTDERGDKAEGATQVEVNEPPQIKQLEAKLALHSIYFPTAQPTVAKPDGGLLASQVKTLTTLASDFKQYRAYKPDAHLILEGHADVRGGKDYNQKLSERRVDRTKRFLIEQGVPADRIETKAHGVDKNMTSAEVKKLLEEDPDLTPAEKQKLLKNLLTVHLANNRRVDVTLSTTGEQSVRRFPFNAEDALALISQKGGETKKAMKPAAKPAPKKNAKP